MSPLIQCLWSSNLSGWWHTARSSLHKFKWPLHEVVLWSHIFKLNTLYLHLQKTHGHQTRQGTDLSWEAPILKAKWPFGHSSNVRSHNNLKDLQLQFQELWPLNLAGYWLRGGGSAHNCLSRHQLPADFWREKNSTFQRCFTRF